MKLRPRIFFILFTIAASFIIGFFSNDFLNGDSDMICDVSKFKFINKELVCEKPYVISKGSYAVLKTTLEKYIEDKKATHEVFDVSIYFRDLENGPTLGINEHAKFIPASLLKVPLMMTYLNLAEDDPLILDKKLAYHLKDDGIASLEQIIKPSHNIEADAPYTINELISYMIVYSDNRAQEGLWNYLQKISPTIDLLKETLQRLGIIDPRTPIEESVTVKAYASIFLQLYHASFFEKKETSEKALALLSDSEFSEGIRAGLPANIPVADKFGERSSNINDEFQLHDCGVVYYPGNPYLLCIMTRGYDAATLENIIQTISRMFYQEIESRKL